MKSTIFLRIASVLTLIHAILHTIGGVFGKPEPGAAWWPSQPCSRIISSFLACPELTQTSSGAWALALPSP